MNEAEKIVIMGGSFNPPHNGHLEMARAISRELSPDIFIFVPVGRPPHKAFPQKSVSDEDRINMTRLTFGEIDRAHVSDIEIKRHGEKSYTVDTVEQIKESFPNAKIHFAMGGDMLLTLEEWHRYEDLMRQCSIIAMSREAGQLCELKTHSDYLIEKYGADISILKMEPIEVSSSQIRAEIENRGDVSAFLPPEVLEYIERRGLYRC